MADTYKQGSFGSRICSSNIRKYPGAESGHIDEYTPAETPFKIEPPLSPYKSATDSEMTRRESNRNRDNRKRFGVIVAPLAADTDSSGGKVARKNAGKIK